MATNTPLTPTLRSSAFNDTDADPHEGSQWQISTADAPDFETNLVYDSGFDTSNLVEIEVSGGVLQPGTTYYWRVRHYDDRYEDSNWSSITEFDTVPLSGPSTPDNVSPVHAATDVELTPDLEASGFTSANVAATHDFTQWQIASDAGFNTIIYDSGVVTAATQTTVPDELLSINTQYFWKVRYQDNYGNWSGYSTSTSFTTTAMQPPDTPSNALPTDAATDISLTPTLSTSAFSDPDVGDTHAASQWRISDTSGDYSSPVYDSGTTTTNKLSIVIPSGNLLYNDTYYWQVRYQDSYGRWSEWSTETSFDTVVSGSPNTPGNVSPTDTVIDVALAATLTGSAFSDPDAGDTHAASQWQITDVSGDYTTTIYDSSVTSEESENLETVTIDTSVLANETVYYWRVRYQDSFGNWSTWSAETSFTTIQWHTPSKPSNISPVDSGIDVILTPTLASSDFHDADVGDTHLASRWQIRSDTGNYTTPVLDSNVDTENLIEYTVAEGYLDYDETYYWRVRYQDNSSQWSSWSDETVFDTITTSVPNPPVNVTPANGATGLSRLPRLETSDFVDEDVADTHMATQWQITTTSGDYDSPVLNIAESATFLTSLPVPVQLEYGTIYYWRVRYRDSYGNWSNWSTETSFTVIAVVSPDTPSITSPEDDSIDLSVTPTLESSVFSDSDAEDTHEASQWQISTTLGDYTSPVYDSLTDTANLTSISVPADELDYNTTYYCRVRYQDGYGLWSAYSAEISFTTIVVRATFSANLTAITEGGVIVLTDTSEGNITSWTWNLGDGTTVEWTEETAPVNRRLQYQYAAAGVYNVSLVVSSADGEDTETRFGYITVNEGTPASTFPTTWVIVGSVVGVLAIAGGYYLYRRRMS